ncbi:MAG: KaiC domain-containing protein [Halobacteriota archaeon]|nr:KaiC domain-containing protein [Halobacteriota archaeon]
MMERVSTGIEGLDDMLGGGLPTHETIAVIGPFGTGKTIFGLQFICEGLSKGESGLFISLDEGEEELVRTASNSGWDLRPFIDEEKLILLKLDASDIMTSITRIQSELPKLLRSFKPQRVVIDPITLLEMLFNDEAERRVQLFNLCQTIKDSGATIVLVSECDKETPYSSKFGLVEYVSDGVVVLRYVRPSDLTEVILAIEIVKMRRVEHSREIKPYSITSNGIIVHSESGVF